MYNVGTIYKTIIYTIHIILLGVVYFQYYFMSNIMYSESFFRMKHTKGLEETMDFFCTF